MTTQEIEVLDGDTLKMQTPEGLVTIFISHKFNEGSRKLKLCFSSEPRVPIMRAEAMSKWKSR